ncbi:MAG: hypothetical protein OXG52_13050 [bacterium]|nr:hypothetical protein [bacterium]
MLTVLSAPGSPGASATALYLAAAWAESGREVLFVEADPAGGTLSHRLGMQFTPGSASFLAADAAFGAADLVEHSQDVLYDTLHVMPSTANPTSAEHTVARFAAHAEALRDVSESGMATVIDGGRATAESLGSPLVLYAAAAVVVTRAGDPQGLDFLQSLGSAAASGDAPKLRVVTIGESPWTASQWQQNCGLSFSGSIVESPDVQSDLSALAKRNKRRVRRWRQSLDALGATLLAHAAPERGSPRPAQPAVEPPSAAQSAPAAAPAPPTPAPTPPPPTLTVASGPAPSGSFRDWAERLHRPQATYHPAAENRGTAHNSGTG